jgi:3-hydroxybutyryl-CoA dehydrogenase
MGADVNIKKVGIVGCGLMGSGIAETCARSGYQTVVREVSDELLQRGMSRLEQSVGTAVSRGKLSAALAEQARGRLRGTTRLEDLADCDLVIEAVIENPDEKKRLFAELDRVCKPEAIIASNTSSIPIIQMATATGRPGQVLGMHFMNPVPVMRLVELVRCVTTSEETLEVARRFGESLDKRVIVAPDRAGFIVNLLLVPYLLDAIRALEAGTGCREDIDQGMVLGCGMPMGPLTLLDFVGLDTTYFIANILFDEFKEARYAPPPLLKQMVLAGWHGRKTGRGFYDYTAGEKPPA